MRQTAVPLLMAFILLAPLGQAQWIDDADDDADESFGVADVDHGRAGAAEIHSVDIDETEEDIRFTVAHGDPPDPSVVLMDTVAYDLEFLHGDAEYRVRAVYVVPLGADPSYNAWLYGDGYDRLGELTIEETEEGFTVTVPKRSIPDQNGAAPAKGSAITQFTIESDSQSIGTICTNGECISSGPQTQDQAPDDGPGATYEFQFGLPQEGDIRLSSPAPVRWSNGEATTFLFEVLAHNMGDKEDTLTIMASDVPAAWTVARIGPVDLAAGEQRAIPVPVRVPFAHEHGSDPRFLLEAFGASGTGRIELGVHYPAIPQPTGHHAQVFFHSREADPFIFEELLYEAVGGGGIANVAYMNTAQEHDGDQSVPVKGSKNNIGGDFDGILDGEVPEYGVIYEWAVPLSPGLRVGMQADANITTEGQVDLGFDVPAGDVKVYGRLAVLNDEEYNFGFNMDFDAGTQIGSIPLTESHPVSGSVSVPITMTGEDITLPFDPDNDMVLFLAAHVIRPDAPLTPNTGVYLHEGDLVLPLQEYHDPVPVDVDFPEEVQQEAVQTLDAPQDSEEAKDAPSIGPLALLTGFGLAAWGRRRLG